MTLTVAGGATFRHMSERTGGSPPHTPEHARPSRAAPVANAARAGASTIAPVAETAPVPRVAYPPAYADVVALVLPLRGQPSVPSARLDALASLATQAELGAVSAPEARVRSAHLVLAETARAVYAVLTAASFGDGPGNHGPRAEPDGGARLEPAAQVAQMAARLGVRLPDEGYVAAAHALCAEVHSSLR